MPKRYHLNFCSLIEAESAIEFDGALAQGSFGSCLDDARIARRIWRAVCGRVQVMSPACLRGVMTAGPDVIRRSGPNHRHGLNTLDPIAGSPDLQFDRFASLHYHPRNSKLLVNSFVRPRRAILPSRPPIQHAIERRRCQDRPPSGPPKAWSLQCRAR